MQRFSRRLSALALFLCFQVAAEIRSLTILHTNDIHARLSPLDNGQGGFASLAAVIRRERANCGGCVLLNAGDLVQGSPVSTIFHGLPVYKLANLFGFDAATLGNHDFDYGWEQAREFMKIAKYPMVCSNIVGSDNQLFTKPYVILTVNKLRVAVIGIETNDLSSLAVPKLLGPWHTLPLLDTVRRYAAELRSRSDLMVLLAHSTGEEEKQLLNSATEIPIIVSGHLHNGLKEAMSQDGRLLVRVKSYTQELGRLELKVDTEKKAPVEWTWKRVPVDSTVAPAEDMARAVKHWNNEVSARVDRPLAVSERAYDERGVKRLIEQAMREETGSDFAFMNLGGVRDTLPRGQLLVRHIWDIMPFDNDVVVGAFKGRELPPVVVGESKVDANRQYTLAVTDFTAVNQSSAENLRTTGLQFPKDKGLLRDMLIDWFRKKKVIGQ